MMARWIKSVGRGLTADVEQPMSPRGVSSKRTNMKRAILIWSLTAALAAATHAKAQTTALTPASFALQKVLFEKKVNDSANDPRWRASLADALHRYCESVLVQVPRNTPQEDAWVDGEWHDLTKLEHWTAKRFDEQMRREQMRRSGERAAKVENSVEYARQVLRRVLSECSSITKSLMELNRASPAAEALLWVRLSIYFEGDKMLWRPAEMTGLVSPNYCSFLTRKTIAELIAGSTPDPLGAHDENMICSWNFVKGQIITYAVIPLLESKQ